MDEEVTIQSILANPAAKEVFVQWCREQLCSENILFYLSAAEYRDLTTPVSRVEALRQILRQHVRPSAPAEVNMKEETRAKLMAAGALDDPPVDLFDALLPLVLKDMNGDMRLRFLRSPAWAALSASAASPTRARSVSNTSSVTPPITGSLTPQEAASMLLRKKSFLGVRFKPVLTSKDVETLNGLGKFLRDSPIKVGFMLKRGGSHQTWKHRWCALVPSMLGYFEHEFKAHPVGVILMREVTNILPDMHAELGLKFTFGVVTSRRVYPMQAANAHNKQQWLAALKEAMEEYQRTKDLP